MAPHNANRGILVIEAPWELDEGDSNRSSVVPFIEGIAKFVGDTEVYYANFYDKKSFNYALDCLCKRPFKDTLVYIAAHGNRKKINNVDMQEVLQAIGNKSKKYNITGVILGSCYVGKNTDLIEAMTTGNNLRWCSGYSSSAEWLPATMVDCAIISQILQLDDPDYKDRDEMIRTFADAIAPFNVDYVIGEDNKGRAVVLKDSLQFIVQPGGQGYKPKTVSGDVFSLAGPADDEDTADQ